MKLLMISTDRNIFDPKSAVAQRQIEYAKKYEEVHIIIFSDKTFKEATLGSNIFIYPTRSISRWFYVFDALRLGRFIVEKRKIGDVTCQDPFETGLVGALIRNREPVSLELQIHTDIGSPYFQKFTFFNRIRTLISKYTLPRADHIRVVSYRIMEYVQRFAEPSHIEVRPIVVDVEKIRNAQVANRLSTPYPQFTKTILMVSRLEKEKNIEMALEAFKLVLIKVPSAGLVIVGSGNQEKNLKNLAEKLGIAKSVIFEGWQNDTVSYYKTCNIFLNTSWYEGYGMTLVEAHAAGAKIISTDVGVAREIGANITHFDEKEIAKAITEALV